MKWFRITISLLSLSFLFTCSLCSQDEMTRKALKIHQKVFTVDSHNDTPMSFGEDGFDMGIAHDARKDHSKVDFPRMKAGGLDGAFFAVFTSQGPLTDEGRQSAYERAKATFEEIYKTAAKYPSLTGIALNPKDGYKLEKKGKTAMFIGLENGYPIGQDLSRVKEYYDLGARYITLCHTRNNDICDSSTDQKGPLHNGLSDFGKQVVKEMNRLGIMVDVSHMSDKSFYDVLAVSSAPVIASHSCTRALCNNPRNLDDDMLKALADNGGVIQMCVLSGYLKSPEPNPEREAAEAAVYQKFGDWEKLSEDQKREARLEFQALRKKYPEELATVKDMVDHIDHVVKVAGIDHVGIGTDFDGGGGLKDCYDVSEMGNITIELFNRDYSKKDIEKIWGGNLFRVMNQVIKGNKK
jgi:membrane dipeptidase